MNAYGIMHAYVTLHNEGVRSRDFGAMLDLFDEHAELYFPRIGFGPFLGRSAIEEAFTHHGPSDELVTLHIEGNGDEVILTYAWARQPKHQAGRIHAEVGGNRIMKLTIDTTAE